MSEQIIAPLPDAQQYVLAVGTKKAIVAALQRCEEYGVFACRVKKGARRRIIEENGLPLAILLQKTILIFAPTEEIVTHLIPQLSPGEEMLCITAPVLPNDLVVSMGEGVSKVTLDRARYAQNIPQ